MSYTVVNAPRAPIAVGLPVHNGENYIREALDSILAQTFGDFRLVIGDNASTDGTEEICRAYARADRRISYHRHPQNIGAARNFNFVFRAARSRYFKWCAHDDVIGPDFLRLCLERMEADPGVSVCHTLTVMIDGNGEQVGTYDDQIPLAGDRAHERFTRILWVDHFTEIWGLMRSDIARGTHLYRSYVGSDRTFLAELLLRGRIAYIPGYHCFRRQHPNCYSLLLRSHSDKVRWFDPSARAHPALTGAAKVGHYLEAIGSAGLPLREHALCIRALGGWLARRGWERINRSRRLYRPAGLGVVRPGAAGIPDAMAGRRSAAETGELVPVGGLGMAAPRWEGNP